MPGYNYFPNYYSGLYQPIPQPVPQMQVPVMQQSVPQPVQQQPVQAPQPEIRQNGFIRIKDEAEVDAYPILKKRFLNASDSAIRQQALASNWLRF